MDTSCTKDEAAAILLGWSDEPIRYRPSSQYPTQEELDNIPAFCLQGELDDRLESLNDTYAEAKFDGKPAHTLEQMRSAINKFKKQIVLARTYLCDIDDELAKGNSSALRVYPKTPNAASEYITLASLKAWALLKYKRDILPSILIIDTSQASKSDPSDEQRPRQKLLDQEKAILAEIERLGYDPKRLPKNVAGKAGVKAEVRKSLKDHTLFVGPTIFDTAWERLRKFEDIANVG